MINENMKKWEWVDRVNTVLKLNLSGAVHRFFAMYLPTRVSPMREHDPEQFTDVTMVQNSICIILNFSGGFEEEFSYTRPHDESGQFTVRFVMDIFGGAELSHSDYDERAQCSHKGVDTFTGSDWVEIEDEKTLSFLYAYITAAVAHLGQQIRSRIKVTDTGKYDFTECLRALNEANMGLDAIFCGLVINANVDSSGKVSHVD